MAGGTSLVTSGNDKSETPSNAVVLTRGATGDGGASNYPGPGGGAGTVGGGGPLASYDAVPSKDPEQLVFERRLCHDVEGVAVRKINQHGKSAIRHVKCLPLDELVVDGLTANRSSCSSRSASLASLGSGAAIAGSGAAPPHRRRGSGGGGGFSRVPTVDASSSSGARASSPISSTSHTSLANNNKGYQSHGRSSMALVWGRRKDVMIPLDRFVAVRKGKVTTRAKRNNSPASRILSLVTDDAELHLDIEAPTKLDRDRFARAFGIFLEVPVLDDDPTTHVHAAATSHHHHQHHGQPPSYPTGNTPREVTVLHSSPSRKDTVAASSSMAPQSTSPPPTPPPSSSTTNHHHATPPSANPSSRPLPPLPQSSSGSVPPPTHLPPTPQRGGEETGDWKSAVSPFRVMMASSAAAVSFTAVAGAETTPSTVIATTSALQKSGAGGDSPVASPSSSAQRAPAPMPPELASQAQAATTESADVPSSSRAEDRYSKDENCNEDVSVASSSSSSSSSSSTSSSVVSSLTGHHGYDQEIVEELHQALNEMRAQLEESRAEAARAVKVAEQAITSAERTSITSPGPSGVATTMAGGGVSVTMPNMSTSSVGDSSSWQNTVTHKAAEAAAQAQKRCAEALAKLRLAEERLEGERRTAQFWRKQAEIAEEEAGMLQTRAAAAQVQRAALEVQLESERHASASQLEIYRMRLSNSAGHSREALESTLERNRLLEMELDRTRRDLDSKEAELEEKTRQRKLNLSVLKRGKSERSMSIRGGSSVNSDSSYGLDEQVLKLQAQAASVREQFELLRRATADELNQLPHDSKNWVEQITAALRASMVETDYLRERLAFENVSRRKLQHEAQDLRGRVRVYCRPCCVQPLNNPLVELASQDTIVFHRDRIDGVGNTFGPLTFGYDRVFNPGSTQGEVYNEVEDVCLSVLEGYNICVLAFGQTSTGKTHTILGDVVEESKEGQVDIFNHGIQLRTLEQIFAIADERSDRFKDSFALTIVEVFNERLSDLIVGTSFEHQGGIVLVTDDRKGKKKVKDDDASSGKNVRLEIRTDIHGETIVQGLVAVEVTSFEQVYELWRECIQNRRQRLLDQGLDPIPYEAASHTIVTLKTSSSNIATGTSSFGRIQFVDLAGADLIPRSFDSVAPRPPSQNVFASVTGDGSEWRFANRSLETLHEVVVARSEFVRPVPYRNSTLTHLLMDSLEHDTKVVVFACVSCDPKDAQETATTLRFASRLSKVTIGHATRHATEPAAPVSSTNHYYHAL